MSDESRARLPRRMTHVCAAIIVAMPLAVAPSLAGNWQGLMQQGLNYAGRAAAAAQRARAARMNSGGGDGSGQQQAPQSETSVHADVVRPAPAPAPAPAPSPTPVTPPPAPVSTDSSSSGSFHERWYGHGGHKAYSSGVSPETPPSGSYTMPHYRVGGQPQRDMVPLSQQLGRHASKSKKVPVLAHDSPATPAAPAVKADPDPRHRLDLTEHDTPPTNPNAPQQKTVDTGFITPLLQTMLDRLKS